LWYNLDAIARPGHLVELGEIVQIFEVTPKTTRPSSAGAAASAEQEV
jgi:hypothetical protein